MLASYILSSTFVPVLSTWLLKQAPHPTKSQSSRFSMDSVRGIYESLLGPLVDSTSQSLQFVAVSAAVVFRDWKPTGY